MKKSPQSPPPPPQDNPLVYQLVPLLRPDPSLQKLVYANPLGLDAAQVGELDKLVVMSVPETTSRLAARELAETVQRVCGRHVFVVTHNIEFLKLELLPPDLGQAILAEVSDKDTAL